MTGKRRKVVMQANRSGFLYALDAKDGNKIDRALSELFKHLRAYGLTWIAFGPAARRRRDNIWVADELTLQTFIPVPAGAANFQPGGAFHTKRPGLHRMDIAPSAQGLVDRI